MKLKIDNIGTVNKTSYCLFRWVTALQYYKKYTPVI